MDFLRNGSNTSKIDIPKILQSKLKPENLFIGKGRSKE